MKPSVWAVGYLPLDIVSYSGKVWHAAGGTAGNVAAILGFLGWDAAVVTDVGDDVAGRRLRRDLKKANVSTEHLRLLGGVQTPRIVHEIRASGHRYRFRCPSCEQSFPTSRPLRSDRARELISSVEVVPNVFFVDRLNAGTLLLAEHFKASGSRIVFEPSRPSRPEWRERMMSIADLVKCANDRPAGPLVGGTPSQIQIVTAGAQGAEYRMGSGKWHSSPAFSYPVVDAGGAGDWTTAGLIHALASTTRLTLKAVGDSLRWAQALAAVSCGAPGARGLAKQQTADAVLRSASFLEQRKDDVALSPAPVPDPGTAPLDACRWCLLPERVAPSAAGTQPAAGRASLGGA